MQGADKIFQLGFSTASKTMNESSLLHVQARFSLMISFDNVAPVFALIWGK
jgi:hypothetical protein